MIAVETEEAEQGFLQPFQKAWLIRDGVTSIEVNSLPAGLLKNLYCEVITYGPNGETINGFVNGVTCLPSFDAAVFVKDFGDAFSKEPFIEPFIAFLNYWGGFTKELRHLRKTFFEITEALYYHLVGGIYDLRFVGNNGIPLQSALMCVCWGLVGDGILPPEDAFEKVRPDVEAFVLPWLAKLDELQVKA